MKIVHIEDYFHPDAGYQINVLPKYQVKQGHECIIVTSDMDKMPKDLTAFFGTDNLDKKDRAFEKETGITIIRLPIYKYLSGRAINKLGFKKIIDNLEPDILFVHGVSTVSGMEFIYYSNKLNYPVVFDTHMSEMASVNPLKEIFNVFFKKVFAPLFKKRNLTVIRTADDPYVQKCLGIPLLQAPLLYFGTDTDLFKPDQDSKYKFRREYNISDDDFVVIYTGKLIKSKGAKILAEAFQKEFTNIKKRPVTLICVGNTEGIYGKQIEEIFQSSENRVIRFPTQNYRALAKFYQAADISVFPMQCSLSFFDAQACGLPVVSEDNNINIDRLQNDNGFNFKSGDIEDFRNKIIECIEMDNDSYLAMGKNAYEFIKEGYDYEYIAQRYTDVLTNELEKINMNKR